MSLENIFSETVETLEIADLEYDVAGIGATEASNSESNHAAFFLVSYRLPLMQA